MLLTVDNVVKICAVIITVAGAVRNILDAIKSFRAPSIDMAARITALETRMTEHDRRLIQGDGLFEMQAETNRATCEAMVALLGHAINGNNVEPLRQAQQRLNQLMIKRSAS